jgi:hypothetical protein
MSYRALVVVSVAMACVALVTGCRAGEHDAGDAPTTTTSVVGPVELAASTVGTERRCEEAAASLGYRVPCPALLPPVDAQPADACPETCTAQAGSQATLDTIFFLDVSNYDTSGSGPVRHLIVEARRIERAPPDPCFGATSVGQEEAGPRVLSLLQCGASTSDAEAVIEHGEGAHAEHLLGFWDEGGVRYVVSVHGSTPPDQDLLVAVAASIDLVDAP